MDDDANKPLVTNGGLDTMRRPATVQAILRRYAGYGPLMQEKRWQRLAFLVDNRRKFYQAFGARA